MPDGYSIATGIGVYLALSCPGAMLETAIKPL